MEERVCEVGEPFFFLGGGLEGDRYRHAVMCFTGFGFWLGKIQE